VDYAYHLAILFAIYTMLATAVNLDAGFAGVTSFGYAAAFELTSYCAGIVASSGYGVVAAFAAAMMCGAAIGFLLSLLRRLLEGDDFAIATLALQAIVWAWIATSSWSGGMMGLTVPASMQLPVGIVLVLGAAGCLAITLLIMMVLYRAPFGRRLRVLREDPVLATSLGIDVPRYRTAALSVSHAMVGLAGSVFALYLQYLHPDSFKVGVTIALLSMAIVGGLGSVWGPWIGALIVTLIPEALRWVGLPAGEQGPLRDLILASLLAVIVLIKPDGVIGRFALAAGGRAKP
jgi:branched-chain amino acid transport system permease protein